MEDRSSGRRRRVDDDTPLQERDGSCCNSPPSHVAKKRTAVEPARPPLVLVEDDNGLAALASSPPKTTFPPLGRRKGVLLNASDAEGFAIDKIIAKPVRPRAVRPAVRAPTPPVLSTDRKLPERQWRMPLVERWEAGSLPALARPHPWWALPTTSEDHENDAELAVLASPALEAVAAERPSAAAGRSLVWEP